MLKIGHRGAMGYKPENTLSSFKHALNLNVDMIELDVHLSKNNEVVVIHDTTTERTGKKKWIIKEKDYLELSSLDFGDGEKIPLLEDVLDLVNKKVKVNIELKGENTAEPVFKIVKKYIKEKKWDYDHFLISSFNFDELKKIRQLDDKIKIGVLIENFDDEIINFAKEITAFSVNVNLSCVNENLVKKIKDSGFKVLVWVANDETEINFLKKINVDGVFSDFPDKLN